MKGCSIVAALAATACIVVGPTGLAAAALPAGYAVVVDESGTTTSGGLGGSGSLSASGQGNVNYGFARECAPSADGGRFSVGAYPPSACDVLGRPFAPGGSPEQPSGFWFTGNENCVSAGHPYSGAVFTWHVRVPQTGRWRVDAYIPTWTSYGFGDVYTLTSADGQSQSAPLTQQSAHGQWVNLFGSHQFAAGQDFTVQLGLTDRADSSCHYQMADQMRWVFEPTPPVNRARPTISGLAVQGQTLAESHGDWTNDPGSYSYRWERCGVSGGGCTPIPGATEQSYTLTAADVGHTILVEETAENPSGATAAVSLPTGVAAAAGSTDGSGTGGTGGGSADANPARIRYAYRATRRWTRFSALSISRVVAGGTIVATCRGGGCPRRALRVAGKREARLHRFIGRRLRPGAKLRIAVSGPGVATRRFTLTVRAARAPKLS